VKVAVVTESFLPHVNGVSNSVCRVLEHLERRGHDAVVVAPGRGPAQYAGAVVRWQPSLPMPGYRQVRLGLAGRDHLARLLTEEAADVVYLASPFVLGLPAAQAAAAVRLPCVAVYQTDVAGFAARYHLGAAESLAWRRIGAIHRRASLTLAPSSAAMLALRRHGVPRVALWRRGVDAERFHPRCRDAVLRRRLAPRGEILVGYVGRLAAEKQVEDLRVLADLPGVRLVVIGDGPERRALERRLPGASFLGFLDGDALPQAVASLDVAVHPGPHETFCQSVQEALACGVPTVAVAAGGPLDLVVPGHTGLLYAPGDLPGLRAAVRALAADPAARAGMGVAARASVAARTWAGVGDTLLAHLAQLTQASGRPVPAARRAA
jgi:phosphatidylinositol alpha 1,6-mannosyltransferase